MGRLIEAESRTVVTKEGRGRGTEEIPFKMYELPVMQDEYVTILKLLDCIHLKFS